MKNLISFVATVAVLLCTPVCSRGIDPPAEYKDIQKTYLRSVKSTLPSGKCTEKNIAVRKSWDKLSKKERKAYIDAVLCLHSAPSRADPALHPGNRNRMDDFASSHANVVLRSHANGLFLPFHRGFLHVWERALREECSYTGYQPYWDIPRWENDIAGSALFDGSSTSLGGNGEHLANPPPKVFRIDANDGNPPAEFTIPPGTGGGCVTTGPFAANVFNISIGPVTPGNPPPNDPMGRNYNPRCLTRDFMPGQTTRFLSWANITETLAQPDIAAFRPYVESPDGPHGAMHAAVGGAVLDFYVSPLAPEFVFLHGWLDLIWALWQGQDWEARKNGLAGTLTWFNRPPSAEATLDDILDYGDVGPQIPVRDMMSTTAGGLCYRYE
ncbi:Di-copper centre-containing protein [Pseudovirgaria hyperparasitica]|uniref:Di-copper centre-containing protein n=1 Tax=Pseudovirgaria hyperparasitica TaxID=470096 RepID=A0A6A6VZ00_9PEZI|nr:Di-copper centre-containing protein [Pseudovirgaria hyperparasitica]KAF2755872.1 Di-copper centre-containing protein [Pseudovirgaria hyperparasitica]